MCGMKRLDLVGFRKGRLTVTGFSHSHVQPSGQKRAMWNAVCECGVEKIISTSNLTHGNTVSCGCKLREGNHVKPHGMASLNHKYKSYASRAKTHKKNLIFDLTMAEFVKITLLPCHYCGKVGASSTKARPRSNGAYVSNGIDRVNSDLGYTIDNCVPCCPVCNRMKLDLTYSNFLEHIERILSYAPRTIKK
jgi:hypothetical protein